VTAALPLGTEGSIDVLLTAPLEPTVFARRGLLLPGILVLLALATGAGLILRGSHRRF
jgi:hypothetical protein